MLLIAVHCVYTLRVNKTVRDLDDYQLYLLMKIGVHSLNDFENNRSVLRLYSINWKSRFEQISKTYVVLYQVINISCQMLELILFNSQYFIDCQRSSICASHGVPHQLSSDVVVVQPFQFKLFNIFHHELLVGRQLWLLHEAPNRNSLPLTCHASTGHCESHSCLFQDFCWFRKYRVKKCEWYLLLFRHSILLFDSSRNFRYFFT